MRGRIEDPDVALLKDGTHGQAEEDADKHAEEGERSVGSVEATSALEDLTRKGRE